jgi:hypothetical protein
MMEYFVYFLEIGDFEGNRVDFAEWRKIWIFLGYCRNLSLEYC